MDLKKIGEIVERLGKLLRSVRDMAAKAQKSGRKAKSRVSTGFR